MISFSFLIFLLAQIGLVAYGIYWNHAYRMLRIEFDQLCYVNKQWEKNGYTQVQEVIKWMLRDQEFHEVTVIAVPFKPIKIYIGDGDRMVKLDNEHFNQGLEYAVDMGVERWVMGESDEANV